MHYRFPKGMRISRLDERELFYRYEFDFEKVAEWLSWRDIRNTVFAVIIGRRKNVHPEEFEEKKHSFDNRRA